MCSQGKAVLPRPQGEKVPGFLRREDVDVTAGHFIQGREKGHFQGKLVVVRDQHPLDGVGDGLPALVVLVKDLAIPKVTMLVDDQKGFLKPGEGALGPGIALEQPGDGLLKKFRRTVAAVGQ